MGRLVGLMAGVCACLCLCQVAQGGPSQGPEKRNFAYVELAGKVEQFRPYREWRSYYWREDFTLLVRDDAGRLHRVISREPTPWNDLRLGTTYTNLKVDWKAQPRVKAIGVKGVDRDPAEFYDLKLEPAQTVTAFIVRLEGPGKDGRDFYVNNWFHHWGPEADRKVLAHYATADPNYTVYGYLNGIAAPFDRQGQELLQKFSPDWGGIIYHARVVPAKNEVGYELRVLHLMGRHKKTQDYRVFYGDPAQLTHLDQRKP